MMNRLVLLQEFLITSCQKWWLSVFPNTHSTYFKRQGVNLLLKRDYFLPMLTKYLLPVTSHRRPAGFSSMSSPSSFVLVLWWEVGCTLHSSPFSLGEKIPALSLSSIRILQWAVQRAPNFFTITVSYSHLYWWGQTNRSKAIYICKRVTLFLRTWDLHSALREVRGSENLSDFQLPLRLSITDFF